MCRKFPSIFLFILPVCTSEILWEVLLYPFDLFSVCIFFWFWQCFGLHTMSWQTEHFLIQKRNHYWFFRFFRVPEFLVFLPPHLLHWLTDFSGLSAVSCYVRNKSILLIVFRIFFFNDMLLHQNGNWVKLSVSLANVSNVSCIGTYYVIFLKAGWLFCNFYFWQ